jgi:signal transduction histidine kinase
MNAAAAVILILSAAIVALAALWWRDRRHTAGLRRRLDAERLRADAADHAADAFFDLVSHELRSPIAAIIGYGELLRDGTYGPVDRAAHEPLHRIGRSARYLLDLIDGTVDLARDRVGDLTPRIEQVALRDIVDDAVQAFRIHADERELEHSVRVDPDIPDVRSDHERLARALGLMLVSAVKHPDGSTLELAVGRETDGATVRIRGIRLSTRPEAADPALRSGLRIAIVAATARLLGGNLHMECGEGGAATELILRIRNAPPL